MHTQAAAILAIAIGATLPSCAQNQALVSGGGLGKVVVYRNGVAYYERRARVPGRDLKLTVPAEQIDDFLKSLTIRDAASGKSLPVSFPSRGQERSGGLVDMAVRLPANAPSEVILTYITESPAWKPSYRISMTSDDEVELEAWAIVDNTSGETWNEVTIGVGSSSALSFRYDLWSIRDVRRETLSQKDRFAVAPPQGASPHQEVTEKAKVVTMITEEQMNKPTGHPNADMRDDGDGDEDSGDSIEAIVDSAQPAPSPSNVGSVVVESRSTGRGAARATRAKTRARNAARKERSLRKARAKSERDEAKRRFDRNKRQTDQLAARLKKSKDIIVIEGSARGGESSPDDRALDRANTMRNELIRRGVEPGRLKVKSLGVVEGRPAGVQLVAEDNPKADPNNASGAPGQLAPVGESHFQSSTPITLERGTSTMVSVLKQRTKGTIVYLYDAESERGNSDFAFRAVRLENPSDNTLEAGPVTVYGEGRFIGEGLTDPIPPRSAALIPFALDRQVIVERKSDRREQISGLVKISRGTVSAAMHHVRDTELKVTNRSHEPVTVFVRHTVGSGWELLDSPKFERLGRAHLFPVTLAAGKTKTVKIREGTPISRTLDLRSNETLDLVEAFLTDSSQHAELASQMKPLMALHREMHDHRAAIATLREQMADYRTRMDELHVQIVSLKMVKSGGKLTKHLNQKLREISEAVQKATLDVVEHQQHLMLTRVKFQDAVSEVTLAPIKKAVAGN